MKELKDKNQILNRITVFSLQPIPLQPWNWQKKRVFSSINQFWRCSNIQNKNTDYFSKHRNFYCNFKRDEICQDLLIFAFDLKEKNVIA